MNFVTFVVKYLGLSSSRGHRTKKEKKMAKNGFKAMDSDMHVFEPADLWQRYIDPKYADRAPVGLNRSFRDLARIIHG